MWLDTRLNLTYPPPHPAFTPGEVVRIQLDALQHNDLLRHHEGIRVAFSFASPANRAVTGPIERFIALVKNPLYVHLIAFEQAELHTMYIVGDLAQQRVRLILRGGRSITYVFLLSRQTIPPYEGCWMTDSVSVEESDTF